MNKFLMLSAAVLLATSASAQEASQSGQQQFIFGTMNGGAYCDGGTGYWSGNLYFWQHTNADCAGAVYTGGPGILSKSRAIGKNANLFDTAALALAGADCSYAFPPKFKIGSTVTILCLNGESVTEGQGLLLPPNANASGAKKSLLSAVKAMIAARGNADK